MASNAGGKSPEPKMLKLADDLVVSLELKPGRKYLLLFDQRLVPTITRRELGRILAEKMGISPLILGVCGNPKEALRGIELIEYDQEKTQMSTSILDTRHAKEMMRQIIWEAENNFSPNVTDLQLHFARERASIISAILPKVSHTCQDQPNVTCFMCNVTQTPRIELYDDGSENGVLCDLFLGENLVERFYPSDFVP